MSDVSDRPWLDVLNRKHEWGRSYSDYVTLKLVHEGRPVLVRVPDNLNNPERLQIRATIRTGDLLALIAFHSMEENDPYERGILMVAKSGEEDVFVVHIWHELFPQVLPHLGLSGAFRS